MWLVAAVLGSTRVGTVVRAEPRGESDRMSQSVGQGFVKQRKLVVIQSGFGNYCDFPSKAVSGMIYLLIYFHLGFWVQNGAWATTVGKGPVRTPLRQSTGRMTGAWIRIGRFQEYFCKGGILVRDDGLEGERRLTGNHLSGL